MAPIASGSQVGEIESQIRPDVNGNLVIGVKMSIVTHEAKSELFEDHRCGRRVKME